MRAVLEGMGRTNDDDVELETTLKELVLNLLGNSIETDVRVGTNLFSCRGHDEDIRNRDRWAVSKSW